MPFFSGQRHFMFSHQIVFPYGAKFISYRKERKVRMKVLLFLIFLSVSVGPSCCSDENNHNGAAHQALCNVLKGAVGMWGKNGEHLSEPLRGALAHTIFGKDGTRNLDALIGSDLPDDYKKGILGSSRVYWCGLPRKEKEYGEKLQMRFPVTPRLTTCFVCARLGHWGGR
ncbi:unnamed protein product [Trypanosoma congolense IL3000]|uniref:WGS project CAEQ00000000 data, annotated contig 463 n=1 Tax=Trypanosoma congolense (strain IL3000) TaxID=1068625 RepID=F9WG37_TRYCI|nr:unnamed protein product [Trypanosoma congolense IL3000]